MFKCYLIKSYHRVLSKNQVDTYGAPVLRLIIAPLVKQLRSELAPIEHSMYIRFLWVDYINMYSFHVRFYSPIYQFDEIWTELILPK
jgi:hypothetical protein